jgi:predicted metallopeptidase
MAHQPFYLMLMMKFRGRYGRDHMVVIITSTCAISAIITKVVSLNPIYGEVYSIQHYVIKFVSEFVILPEEDKKLYVKHWKIVFA